MDSCAFIPAHSQRRSHRAGKPWLAGRRRDRSFHRLLLGSSRDVIARPFARLLPDFIPARAARSDVGELSGGKAHGKNAGNSPSTHPKSQRAIAHVMAQAAIPWPPQVAVADKILGQGICTSISRNMPDIGTSREHGSVGSQSGLAPSTTQTISAPTKKVSTSFSSAASLRRIASLNTSPTRAAALLRLRRYSPSTIRTRLRVLSRNARSYGQQRATSRALLIVSSNVSAGVQATSQGASAATTLRNS